MIYDYDCEKKEIPIYPNKKTILDVKLLKSASTTFLHKLIDVKDKVVVVNLNGQPKQVFEICGLDKLIKTYHSVDAAKKDL
jgi:hypothetical protein